MLPPSQIALRVFLSHKCDDHAHQFASDLATALGPHHVELLVDPVRIGDSVVERLGSVPCDAVIFLCSENSWASAYCQAELEGGRQRKLPLLVVKETSFLPAALMDSLAIEQEFLMKSPEGLLVGLQSRCFVSRIVRRLSFSQDTEQDLLDVLSLYDHADSTVLSEQMEHLKYLFHLNDNIVVKGWLAATIGRCRTQPAIKALEHFSEKQPAIHPLLQYRIEEALSYARNGMETVR